MHSILYSQNALNNLLDIKSFIQRDNPIYAQKVVERITWFIEWYLTLFPQWGQLLKIESDVRIFVEPTFKYRIVYKIFETSVYIVSVSKYKQI